MLVINAEEQRSLVDMKEVIEYAAIFTGIIMLIGVLIVRFISKSIITKIEK